MRSTMRTRAAAAVGALLLAGLLTACGDDDGDGYPFAGGGVPGSSSDGKNDKGGGGKGGKVPSDLVGEWSTTSVSLTQYQDANTGVSAPTNGTGVILKIDGDGSYTEDGLMQIGAYSCQSKYTLHTEGKVSVDGDKVTFKPSKVRSTVSGCGGDGKEKDGTKVTRVETYAFTKDQYSGEKVLQFTDEQGQRSQYRPSK